MVLIWHYLLLAHFIADFPLQSDFIARLKGDVWYLMFVHVSIYTLVVCAVLDVFAIFEIWKMALIFISHLTIDLWKCNYAPKEKSLTLSLYVDQALHLLVLAICLF